MHLLQFDRPIISDTPDLIKPVPLENKPFPYNEIADDRRFEELVYSIYSILIKEERFHFFDDISLMSGVRDKGRDCALFTKGKSTGTIQCKQYSNNLSKQIFGEEITKFILYSLLDDRLIADPKNFTYFILVSKGFVSECSDFIDDFSTNILTDEDLSFWISKNLKNPTLKQLELIPSTPESVREILGSIKVKKIIPQDLDALLAEPAMHHLQPLFFQVRTLVTEESVKRLHETFKNYFGTILNKEGINNELQKGSVSLFAETNHFDDIPDSHIERNETQDLFSWVNKKCEADKHGRPLNVCLLAANAGMGKTVIVKDLYDKLLLSNIPVLGLKADKLHSANMQDLQHKLGVRIPLQDLIEQCKEKYKTTVIIIDQIDALSQSMSSNRNYLENFRTLIDQFTFDPNIKIIISVRLFDLNYDPSLRIYKNLKTIKVNLLDESEVYDIVSRKGISRNNISPKLLQLLRTPNHLNIFVRISATLNANTSINTLHELYTELYESKIRLISHQAPVTPTRVKKLLFKIVKKMFSDQTITVSKFKFEDFLNELSYLESERLIKTEDRQLQFFHQTFYDFIFAKRFVENSNDLIAYVKTNNQSIMIRSAVKMILNYLREYSFKKYIISLTEIFSDQQIFFHVKHMCYCLMLLQDQAAEEEIELACELASKDINYRILLFENAKADNWFKKANQMGLIRDTLAFLEKEPESNDAAFYSYILNITVSFFRIYLNKNQPEAWNTILRTENKKLKQEILFSVDHCDNGKFIELFEQCTDFDAADSIGYYAVLHQISKFNPHYCFNLIEKQLSDGQWNQGLRQTVNYEKKITSVLASSIPNSIIPILLNHLLKELNDEAHYYLPFYDDHIYTGISLYKKQSHDDKGYNYKLIADYLRQQASIESLEFKNFLDRHLHSRLEAVLRLIIYAFTSSEELYIDEIFKLFMHFHESECFITTSDLGAEFRDLLHNSLPYFGKDAQNTIINLILALQIRSEMQIWKFNETPKLHLRWGKTQHALLSRIPQSIISENSLSMRRMQELNRKFPKFREVYRSGNLTASIVQGPLPDSAIEKMTVEQWLKSFRKYSTINDSSPIYSRRGGMHEHTWDFKKYAAANPESKTIEIISRALDEKDISKNYAILGVLGLCEAKLEPELIYTLYKKLMPVDDPEELHTNFLIRIGAYIIRSGIEDSEILAYIVNHALDWDRAKNIDLNPETETSDAILVHAADNTSYGLAAKSLVKISNQNYKETVFDTVEKILAEGPIQAKALLLNRLVYLNNFDRSLSFKIFTDFLLEEKNIYMISSSLWSLQYMANIDFKSYISVFEKLIQCGKLGKDDSQRLFLILYSCYIYDENEAEDLLLKLTASNKYTTAWAFQVIFKNFYHKESTPEKANIILKHILKIEKSNPINRLEITYSGLDQIKITHIEDFLRDYIYSEAFYLSDPLISYLTLQCNQFPRIAIDLFNLAWESGVNSFKTENRYQRNDESIKFIVSAFNALKSNDKTSIALRDKLLRSFDTILIDYRFRRTTENILDELV